MKRTQQPMSELVRQALKERGLVELYGKRPPYQRNDYLGWINRAKRMETKLGRLEKMLEELESGDRYMNMTWSGPRKRG